MNKNKNKNSIGIIILAVLAIVVVFIVFNMSGDVTTKKYSEVISLFEQEKVSEFTLNLTNGQMAMVVEGEAEKVYYKVPWKELFLPQIMDYVEEYNTNNPDNKMVYDILPPTDSTLWMNLGMLALTFIALIAFGFLIFRQTGGAGKAMGVGRAKVKGPLDEKNKKTFKDVAGADEEKEELQEIVEFLKNPEKFNALGARIPRGVLFVGPPGTGKTLLAKACAGEAGVPFYSISGSDFVEMYVGVGASRVRDLFEKAKKTAPSIVFIDEIDAVGRQRGAGLGGGHDEREQTLNQLLVEMDGFGVNEGVIVVAATNRADILDKALLRPGRFDRQVYVGYPDIKGREEILKVHTRNKPLAPDVNLKTIAKSTIQFTGADLENLINEAALLAARHNRKAITLPDIEEARNKVTMGPEKKSRVRTQEDNKLTAYHEAGHAITAHFCEKSDPVHQITIVPRGQAGGYTMQLPKDDRSYVQKGHMTDMLVVFLGGRVAEKIVLDDVSTGASSDLQRATDIARSMVTRYGFSDKLGPVVYGQDQHETFLGRDLSSGKNYSETVAAEIDAEIRNLLDTAFESAEDLLTKHIDKLHAVANALLERETLNGEEFETLMRGEQLPPMETPVSLDVVVDDNTKITETEVDVVEKEQPAENNDSDVIIDPNTENE